MLVFGAIFFVACSTNNDEDFIEKNLKLKSSNNLSYNYEIQFEEASRELKVFLTKEGTIYSNTFIYIDTRSKKEIFKLDYDNREENWKYGEQDKAIEFANKLKSSNINLKELETIC